MPAQFADQVAPGSGTALNASTLDALAVAQSYWQAGTTPSVPGSGLVLTIPAQTFVINTSPSSATAYTLAGSATLGGNGTWLIDGNGTTYTAVQTANPAAGYLRMYQVVASGGNITNVIASPTSVVPIGQSQVQIGANGIATTDGANQVLSYARFGVRQRQQRRESADQTLGTSAWTNWPGTNIPALTVTVLPSGTVTVRASMAVYNFGGSGDGTDGGSQTLRLRVITDGNTATATYLPSGTAGNSIRCVAGGEQPITGLSVGSHTFQLQYYNGGGNFACRAAPLNQEEAACFTVEEYGA